MDACRDARGDAGLRTLLLALYDYAVSLPDPDGWFAAAESMYRLDGTATVDDLPWAETVAAAVANEVATARVPAAGL